MPIPIVAAIPWIVGALGGSLLTWAAQPDDEWEDADVFNSRMRQIHVGILQANNLWAKCSAFKDPVNADTKQAWKSFVVLWSQFYRDVGTVMFDPSLTTIAEAKHYAQTLSDWLKTYQRLCGPLPTGTSVMKIDPPPAEKGGSWESVLLWGIGIATSGYVAVELIKRYVGGRK